MFFVEDEKQFFVLYPKSLIADVYYTVFLTGKGIANLNYQIFNLNYSRNARKT